MNAVMLVAMLTHERDLISNHDGSWLFRVRDGKTFERGYPAESLVGCDEDRGKSGTFEAESDRKLQGIERPEGLDNAILDEQLPGILKMSVVDRSHQQTAAAQIGFQASSRDEYRLLIDFSGPCFYRENRFHFDNGEARDEILRTRF